MLSITGTVVQYSLHIQVKKIPVQPVNPNHSNGEIGILEKQIGSETSLKDGRNIPYLINIQD